MVAILHKQETTICALLDIFIIILCRTYCPALWNKFNNILCQRPHIKESNKRSHGQFLLALAAYNPLWIVIIHLLVPSVLVYDYSIQPPCPIMFQSCWMNARTAVWDNFLNIFSPKQCPVEQGWSQSSLSSTPLFQNTYVLNISGHSPTALWNEVGDSSSLFSSKMSFYRSTHFVTCVRRGKCASSDVLLHNWVENFSEIALESLIKILICLFVCL